MIPRKREEACDLPMSSKADPSEENNSTYKGPISITNPKEENIVDVIQNMLTERNDLIHNQLLVVDDMIRNPTTENVGPEDEGIVKRILKRDGNIQELLKMSKDMDELKRDLKRQRKQMEQELKELR